MSYSSRRLADEPTSRFSDLTGTDYSQGAVDLAQKLAARDGFSNIKFLVCYSFVI